MIETASSHWLKRRQSAQRAWDKFVFGLALRRDTLAMHTEVLAEAESALAQRMLHESDAAYSSSSDPLVHQGWLLKTQVENQFRNLYFGKTTNRILIHVPAPTHSPAGYSLFTNLAESLEFIGISTCVLEWNGDTQKALDEFRPSVLLTSDQEDYLSRLDWSAIHCYAQLHQLRVGLTASLEEYGGAPLAQRLNWARENHVDFYYTFRDEGYVTKRSEYAPFFEAGYPMLYLPFGANILHYYPVAGFERDLDYAIMATRKAEHMSHMKGIVGRYKGFIDGPGWKHVRQFRFNRERDRYIYARAKVGLNVHLPEQLEWACEVNERTYQLAACGVPQLVDDAKLLKKIFDDDMLFVAKTTTEYRELFELMHRRPELAVQRALNAQKRVFQAHTTFHRAADLIKQLMNASR